MSFSSTIIYRILGPVERRLEPELLDMGAPAAEVRGVTDVELEPMDEPEEVEATDELEDDVGVEETFLEAFPSSTVRTL